MIELFCHNIQLRRQEIRTHTNDKIKGPKSQTNSTKLFSFFGVMQRITSFRAPLHMQRSPVEPTAKKRWTNVLKCFVSSWAESDAWTARETVVITDNRVIILWRPLLPRRQHLQRPSMVHTIIRTALWHKWYRWDTGLGIWPELSRHTTQHKANVLREFGMCWCDAPT